LSGDATYCPNCTYTGQGRIHRWSRYSYTDQVASKAHLQESPGQAALDALASDGPIAQAPDAGADATHIPELFRSVETKVLVTPVAEETKKNVEHVKGLGSRMKDITLSTQYIPEPVRDQVGQLLEWWKQERVNKGTIIAIPQVGCHRY
jgi:hypothetical protein